MEKSKNVRFIENIFIQESNTMPPEKSYFPAIAILKLNKEMVNLNSAVLTFDGPLYSVKTDIYHPNDKTYSGNCYSHVALKKGNLSRGINNKTIRRKGTSMRYKAITSHS